MTFNPAFLVRKWGNLWLSTPIFQAISGFAVGCRLQLAVFMRYSDKIQKDKSISKRICSYLVREWGMLSHSRLLLTAVVKFSFGWWLSLDGFLHRQADLCQITVCLLNAYGLEVVKYICIGVERYFDVRVSHQVL